MARNRKQTTAQEIHEMDQLRARIRDAEAKLKTAQAAAYPGGLLPSGVPQFNRANVSYVEDQARKQSESQGPTPGFAIEIKPDTDLGLAMLIAEDEEYHCEPVAVVATINEAKEIATGDMRRRMRELERGGDPGICPWIYKVWARGLGGDYRIAAEFDAAGI